MSADSSGASKVVSTRLARRLGVGDAVVVGLGSMIGAGIFAVLAPAARAAGSGLLIGLLVAAFVAYCNATSSAALAARYPESGGTYVYARRQLNAFWGFVAGWGFVIGKLASCAAMALTFAAYAAPAHARTHAIAAVIVMTGINYLGIGKTVLMTRIVVAFVLACLATVVVAAAFGGAADLARAMPMTSGRAAGILEAAGFLFFAFAGYARIATLGEEVVDPARTIPQAIPVALGVTLLVYAAVAVSALAAVDAQDLARTSAPLVRAVESGRFAAVSPIVRIGAAVASLGVLLSLLAGVSRTAFAMGANGDLPVCLAAVHPRHRVPYRAELAAGAIVVLVVAAADVRGAIGFSAFAVLVYYAIANVSALTLRRPEHYWPRLLAACGLAGCALLAFSLPLASMIEGGVLLAAGAAVYAMRGRRKAAPASDGAKR
jgi:APA family basic amino acid/polyamine antiporter